MRSKLWMRLAFGVIFCALLGVSFAAAKPPAKQRAFKVDDLFKIEGVGRYFGGPYAFSADGHKLAYTRVRPKKTLANYMWEFLWDNAGGDVWVQSGPNEQPFNVTNGAKDGSGWWSPQWSPDGTKLAMLSTRGGNVRVWVWDARTRNLRQATQRGVDLGDVHERPYLWVDSEHLLCPVLPGDQKPQSMIIELQTPMIATAEWPKAPKGKETTANVLESGVPIDLSKRPQGDLLLIDVATGNERVVAHAKTVSWQLSPNGKVVAYAQQVSQYQPKANEPLPFALPGLYTIKLAALDGSPVNLRGEMSRDVLTDSLRWSPDGNELAFAGYAAGRDEPPVLYRVNLSQHTLTRQPLKNLDITPIVRESVQVEWTANGDLMVRAAKRVGDTMPDVKARRDWWLIGKDGTVRCLSEGIKDPPREVWPQNGRQAFIGMADDNLWRLSSVTGKPEDLTAHFGHKIARISWPSATNEGTDQYRIPGQTYAEIILSVQTGDGVFSPYILDLHSGRIAPIQKPAEKAVFVAYEPKGSTGIFYDADRNGLQIWRTDVHKGKTSELVSANTFLRDIAEGEYKPIEYTSLNGEKLKGWLLLPYGYEPGKRYPLIAWVYPGAVYHDRPPSYDGIDSSGSLNMQIPAANGYVVLFPSMPLAPEGIADDPMLRLTEGVLPAVDKAVEMGIADPSRLFLMGQSFGGFATYGLVTQTQRFKAAVSLAGLSDLISLWGQFDARERYTHHPEEELFQEALTESAQVHMGGPPWKEWNRYVRNSPIFYVDRVQTPLMIIQGDIDYVAIQQGEEFFMSLHRQGKRAEFVRYWGEGHVLESPANIRDMWKRIFAWLEEFSAPTNIPGKKPAVN